MSFLLKFVWKLLGAIQLMVHFPMFSISFPANTKYLYSFVINLANMKIIPTDYLLKKITGYSQIVMSGDFSYGDNFVASFGLLFFLSIAFITFIALLGVIIFAMKGNNQVLNVVTKIKQALFFNSFLRFLV